MCLNLKALPERQGLPEFAFTPAIKKATKVLG
jgi:hypothetical protein